MAEHTLNPVNLTEEQTQEFFRIYRILTSDFLELESFITKKEGHLEDALSDTRMFESVEDLIELALEGDIELPTNLEPDIKHFRNVINKQIDMANDFITNSRQELEAYSERLERSREFIKRFKDGITLTSDNGDCTVSDEVMFLVEYLNSLGNILEPEEREELLKRQQG